MLLSRSCRLFLFPLLVLTLSSSAFAANDTNSSTNSSLNITTPVVTGTIYDVLPAYLNEGEAYSIVNVSSGGYKNYILFISGNPSLVLRETMTNGTTTFPLLTSQSDIMGLLSDYVATQFSSFAITNTTIVDILSNYTLAQSTVGSCYAGINYYLSNPYLHLHPMLQFNGQGYTLINNQSNPAEFAAQDTMNASFLSSNDSIQVINADIPLLNSSYLNKDVTSLLSYTDSIHSAATKLYNGFTVIASSYATIAVTFPQLFVNETHDRFFCNSADGSPLLKIVTLTTINGQWNTSLMYSQISQATSLREPIAEQRNFVISRQAELSRLVTRFNKIRSTFASANQGIQLQAIDSIQQNLSMLIQTMQNSTSSNATQKAASQFDAKYQSAQSAAAAYESAAVEYVKAVHLSINATAAINSAIVKYGGTDDRLLFMQQQLAAGKADLKSVDAGLSTGTVSVDKLKSIQASFLDIYQKASTLAPKENQLDLTVIIAGIVVVIVLVGVVFYLRKLKGQGGLGALTIVQGPPEQGMPPK